MDHAKTVMLEDESPIASLKAHPGLGIVSVGDEFGCVHLLNDGKALTKICVEKEVCLVDHCWINSSQIAYTCGKEIKIYDFAKQTAL